MNSSRLRIALSTFALVGAALLVSGCAQTPASPPPTSSSDKTADASGTPTPPVADTNDIEASWLDGGRGLGIVTWGSSTCVPQIDDVQASGQSVTVTLANKEEKACTMDLVPRGVFAGIPEGVDVTKDIDLQIVYGKRTEDIDLDGLAEAPQGPSEQQPSAGWFEDDGIALLTWGSSTCLPVVEDVEMTDAGATVTFAELERVCTRDLGPRVTAIMLQEDHNDDVPFQLTLTGDNLSGTVSVLS